MRKFYKGMDISSLPEVRELGAMFFNESGEERGAFELMKEYGIDSVRLRIWNQPELVPAAGGYCSLAHTIEMAKELRRHGMHFMLDFHYSDHWADPAKQNKPAAWKDLPFEELKAALHDYTVQVLTALDENGCLPDIVQVGNEIRSGMLFPDGAVSNYRQLTELLNEGIRACREVSEKAGKDINVMIHLDQGGRFYYLREWFDEVFAAGLLPIDSIGISFYSFWHGTFMDLRDSMTQLVERYSLPVYIVETAHPWRLCENGHPASRMMDTAGLPAGVWEQKRSLEMIMQIADTVAERYGIDTGVYYWEPMQVPGSGHGSWSQNMGILGPDGRVLPSYIAYRDFRMGDRPVENLDEYMEGLYRAEESSQPPAGTNLIPGGDFAEGTSGFWVECQPGDGAVEVRAQDGEVYVSSRENFVFRLFRDIHIEKAGEYCLSIGYRGTNTTGVEVTLFLKVITCNGERIVEKEIFPSDVGFVTHRIDQLELEKGMVQVGICLNAPPVFGRMRDFRLVETDGE